MYLFSVMNEFERFKIFYEDNHLLVVEKPANMPAQPDASGDIDLLTLLKAYLKKKYHKPGNVFLGLVHRLDRPTGGLMVFARTSKAASRLSDQLRRGTVGKIYLAIVEGITPDFDRLINYLEKDRSVNIVQTVNKDNPKAKKAELTFQTLDVRDGNSLVRIQLMTGRSHQIRVQFAAEGHPLYGDRKYNREGKNQHNLALYASELSFEHPTSKELLHFSGNPPSIEPWTFFPMLRGRLTGDKA